MRFNAYGWVDLDITLDGLSLEVSSESRFLALGKSSTTGYSSTLAGLRPFPYIITENPNGNISAYLAPVPNLGSWQLKGVSAELYSSMPIVDFGSPFSSSDAFVGSGHSTSANDPSTASLMIFVARGGESVIGSVVGDTTRSGT